MRTLSLAFTLAAFAMVSPAANAADTQSASGTETGAGDPNQNICRERIPLGSRIARSKSCASRAEWAERDKKAEEAARREGPVNPLNGGRDSLPAPVRP